MSGIGVVLNPKSRRNVRDPGAARRLARRLGDHGIVRAASSIEELYRIAEDFRRLDIDVLAISGGDGTGHVTLTGFLDVYRGAMVPQVALLRGGTMNTVANSVGVRRGAPEGLLARLVRAYARRATLPLAGVERHVMRVRADDGEAQYGFLFGTGVVRGFLAEYYSGSPTPWGAVKTLARSVGSAVVGGEMIRRMAEPFRGSVTLDGTPEGTIEWEERDYLTIAAGTIADIGLGFRPFHRFAERDGAFHILGIHASPIAFAAELPRIHRAHPMRAGRAHEATAERAILSSPSGRIQYMIDGDLHGPRAGFLTIEVGPVVRLLVEPEASEPARHRTDGHDDASRADPSLRQR